jgi:hypothetical protein
MKNIVIYQQLIAALRAEKAAARKAYFKKYGTLRGLE